jgi:hypothetical protein
MYFVRFIKIIFVKVMQTPFFAGINVNKKIYIGVERRLFIFQVESGTQNTDMD